MSVILDASHRYWDETGKELYGITNTIKAVWPSTSDAPEAAVQNAQDRGIEVDTLISRYLTGSLLTLPAGTREDSKELFFRFIEWAATQDRYDFTGVQPQVILSDGEYAGTCDLLFRQGAILDVKCTYNLEFTHELQLGGYADMYLRQLGNDREACEVGILHLTKRFAKPRLVMLDEVQCMRDWLTIRAMHGLLLRKEMKR